MKPRPTRTWARVTGHRSVAYHSRFAAVVGHKRSGRWVWETSRTLGEEFSSLREAMRVASSEAAKIRPLRFW